MFSQSAEFYDAIYAFKDYPAEAAALRDLVRSHCPAARSLLDAACGTGAHLGYLRADFSVSGFDPDANLIAIARERLPGIDLHVADMTTVALGQTYDVVTCLFSAIGYVVMLDRLYAAVLALRQHVAPGGLLVIEPWFTPDQFRNGFLSARFIDEPTLKLARMTLTEIRAGDPVPVSVLHFHYLVGTHTGFTTFTEDHTLGLFSDADYRAAFSAAGLSAIDFIEGGLDGRGLYVGRG